MSAPSFDLHTALAAMADYPAVLRRLGVIRVIEVDLAGSGIGAGDVVVSARPAWPTAAPADQVHVAPIAVPGVLDGGRFALHADGRVDPVEAGIGVLELDTDSAALRHVDLARQVVNAEFANDANPDLPPVTLPERMALPSLRNAGLSLYQTDRAVALRNQLVGGSALLTASGEQALSAAAQAVMGYVVDVWDDRTRRWHTLCARRGTYLLPDGSSFTEDDEGPVSMAVTSRSEALPTSPLYLHQSILRWTGWSLVAPPVGEVVITESAGHAPDAPEEDDQLIDVRFAALPGSLPVLRFGRGYRFQLRTMDVAGQAEALDPRSTDFSRAVPAPPAPPVRYLRFEPVLPPVVVATAPMTEGESLETLVLRPEPVKPGPTSNVLTPIVTEAPQRHVVPSKASQLLCEHHGVVDTPAGVPDPRAYRMLAERDRADLQDVGEPDPRNPQQRYVDQGMLHAPWLPDPMGRGAALHGLPDGPRLVTFDQPLGRSWPNLRSFRIQMADGRLRSFWNPLQRVVTIRVPRGESLALRLSCTVGEQDLPVLGHLEWLQDSGADAATVAAARADLLTGRAWQVTPYRTLTLVNAVRRPTQTPVLAIAAANPDAPRALGETTQDLAGTVVVHRPSTGQLALVGTWTDPVDDPADPDGPGERTTVGRPVLAGEGTPPSPSIDVAYDPDPVSGAPVAFTGKQSIGDTRRHLIAYEAIGTTRYLEHFVQRATVVLEGTTPFQVSRLGIVPGTDQLRAPGGGAPYRRDVDYAIDPGNGTIARVDDGAIPDGEAVEIALVAPPVSRTSAPATVDVLSTTRPDPPVVGWIVPSYGWSEGDAMHRRERTRTRHGGGLRIFLERPWWSSGYGEQLAVVLANGPVAATDDQLRALVTTVGADPVVVTGGVGEHPAPTDLPLATSTEAGLTLPELVGRPGTTVAIAAHDVVWDAARGRWACDVVLPPGLSYTPFVRLALARYQPGSIDGVELSAVAPVEWAQLAPDRTVTLLRDPRDRRNLTVTVAGVTPTATVDGGALPNQVTVLVQSSDAREPGELDWETVGPPDGTVLAPSVAGDGTAVWRAALRLPNTPSSVPLRLVVTEHERHGTGRLAYADAIRL